MQIAEKILVGNPAGLHLRGAVKLVLLVDRYKSNIIILKGFRQVNARSIIGVMGLCASIGTELEFVFEGEDAEEARDEIRAFFEQDFGE